MNKNKNVYEVVIDYGSKHFRVEAKNSEEAKKIIKQQIKNNKNITYNEEFWIGDVRDVEELNLD